MSETSQATGRLTISCLTQVLLQTAGTGFEREKRRETIPPPWTRKCRLTALSCICSAATVELTPPRPFLFFFLQCPIELEKRKECRKCTRVYGSSLTFGNYSAVFSFSPLRQIIVILLNASPKGSKCVTVRYFFMHLISHVE